MAMSSFSPATTSLRSISQQPRISTQRLNPRKPLLSLSGNAFSGSSPASFVKLQCGNTLVLKGLPHKRTLTITCATIEEIEAEKSSIQQSVKEKMDKTIDNVRKTFASVRSGRSNPGMLDKLMVEYYGSPVNVKTLAQISAPDASSLLVQPYDKSSLKGIEKAIVSSNLGLTPNNDGQVLRLTIPPLTSERRKELSKVVAKQAEEGKVAIRMVRREAIKAYEKLEKEKKLSEDNVKGLTSDLQKVTDEYIKKIDAIYKEKEKELMTV